MKRIFAMLLTVPILLGTVACTPSASDPSDTGISPDGTATEQAGTPGTASGTATDTAEEGTEDVDSPLEFPSENLSVTDSDGRFFISYADESYVNVGGSTRLFAEFRRDGDTSLSCRFVSQTRDVADCTADGVVTGRAPGLATVRAFVNERVYFDFYVTVLPDDLCQPLAVAVRAHNSNIFVRKNLGIGAGTPVYYRDVYGSVSKLQYNDELVIDRTFEKRGTENTAHSDGPRSRFGYELEYITVHYTGNMDVNATARNNADYFADVASVSVHYVTGNDGVYSCLDDAYVSWNAGDRGSGAGPLRWRATGVYADPDSEDPTPVLGISAKKKFTVNGRETDLAVPRRKDITYNSDTTFELNGNTYPAFTLLGLPWKIVDGEYWLGNAWWCYRTSAAGCLCGVGGDYNSISVESAVNPETDLWYTWHKTAQLVAKLLVDNGLDNTRVTGHHMWTQKDCPQPMLENDLEIWHEFLNMVRCEREKIESGCTYSFRLLEGQAVSTDTDQNARLTYNGKRYVYTQNPGRIIPDEKPHIILYEVSVDTPDGIRTVKLATAVCATRDY